MTETTQASAKIAAAALPVSTKALKEWMVSYVGQLLALDPTTLDTSARFDTFGMDSIEAVVMAGIMEEEFGAPVEPSLLLEYPSIDLFTAACTTEG